MGEALTDDERALFTKLTGRGHASTLCGSMYIAVIADELAF
jgi:hypothetical protein